MKPEQLVARLQRSDPDAASAGELAGLFAAVRQLAGWTAAVEARLARRAAELEALGAGAPAAEVIRRGTNVSSRSAQRTERRSSVLAQAPAVEHQLRSGRISTEHVDALANAAAQLEHDDQRAALLSRERQLAHHAASETPSQFARTVRRIAGRLDDGVERSERQRAAATLSHGISDDTGMGWIRAELHPDDYQRVARRLDAEVTALRKRLDRDERPARYGRLAAEAAINLITGARAVSSPPAEVIVLIDLETLEHGVPRAGSVCEYSDGTPAPVEAIRRHACDARLIPVVLDSSGMPIDVGRGARHATTTQRRALRSMYRTCAIDGCDRPFDGCEIHHLRRWEDGGCTDLDNMVPLCSYHHHRAHEGRWRLRLDASTRRLTVTLGNGDRHSTSTPDRLAEAQRVA